MSVSLDPVLEIFLLIKNNWSLTGDLATGSISWSTGFYDSALESPQIVVTQTSGDKSEPLSMGSSGSFYRDTDIVNVGIWVRPVQDSNTSFGWAKNATYKMRKEVERIVRSGSNLGQDVNGYYRFAFLGTWKRFPSLDKRPVLLNDTLPVNIVKTVKGV